MPRHWEVVLFVAAILAVIFLVIRNANRRRRPERFQHDGRTYQRRPDGTFLTDSGAPIAGAVAIGALAAAYQAQCGTSSLPGWMGGSSSDGDGCSGGGGGDGGGGDGGGGGGGD